MKIPMTTSAFDTARPDVSPTIGGDSISMG